MGGTGLLHLSPIARTRKKLIQQAVGAIYGESPPADLQLAWKCQKWGALPCGGGMYDQPFVTMQNMTVLSNVYDTVSYMRNLHGDQIHRLTESQRRLIRWLIDQGISVL